MTSMPDEHPVRTRRDLQEMLLALKSALRDGAVRRVPAPHDAILRNPPIEEIPVDGPWPDYIELSFVDEENGERWILEVDTFTGAGGAWRRLN